MKKGNLLYKSPKYLVTYIPAFIMLLWSGNAFFTKGIPAELSNWRFYATVIGFLGFYSLWMLVLYKFFKNRGNKNEIKRK